MWKVARISIFLVVSSQALNFQEDSENIYDSETCGKSSQLYSRFIRGGSEVKFMEMPWSVTFLPNKNTLCSGTLITRKHVLTAAHCFETIPSEFDLTKARVKMTGMCGTKSCRNSIGRKVKKVFFREEFNANAKKMNDIMLLELDKPVPREVHHACLPTDDFGINWYNDKIYVSGVGDRYSGDRSSKLMKTLLGKRDWKHMLKLLRQGTFVVTSDRNQAVCPGDSGGGATSIINGRHVLVGVTSTGECEQHEEGAANEFTDVEQRMPQILEALDLKL